eukprot:scaffold24_cov341-Pavlova_lutheri.AAC.108
MAQRLPRAQTSRGQDLWSGARRGGGRPGRSGGLLWTNRSVRHGSPGHGGTWRRSRALRTGVRNIQRDRETGGRHARVPAAAPARLDLSRRGLGSCGQQEHQGGGDQLAAQSHRKGLHQSRAGDRCQDMLPSFLLRHIRRGVREFRVHGRQAHQLHVPAQHEGPLHRDLLCVQDVPRDRMEDRMGHRVQGDHPGHVQPARQVHGQRSRTVPDGGGLRLELRTRVHGQAPGDVRGEEAGGLPAAGEGGLRPPSLAVWFLLRVCQDSGMDGECHGCSVRRAFASEQGSSGGSRERLLGERERILRGVQAQVRAHRVLQEGQHVGRRASSLVSVERQGDRVSTLMSGVGLVLQVRLICTFCGWDESSIQFTSPSLVDFCLVLLPERVQCRVRLALYVRIVPRQLPSHFGSLLAGVFNCVVWFFPSSSSFAFVHAPWIARIRTVRRWSVLPCTRRSRPGVRC